MHNGLQIRLCTGAAWAQVLYEEVSLQQQSCAPEAHSAPRRRWCLNLLLAVFGKMPRYQRKATLDSDTAVHLCTSVHNYSLIYIRKSSPPFPLLRLQGLSSAQVSRQS